MNTRPAWGALLIGAVIVIALLVSPLWLKPFSSYIEEQPEARAFPDAFYTDLSREEQDLYNELYETEPRAAVAFVQARLAEPTVVDELPPDTSELLLTGQFVRLNVIRGATGTANLYRLTNGDLVLRIEEFDAINGPGLKLMFSRSPTPTTKEDLGQLLLDEVPVWDLKGTQGNQNYLVTGVPAFNADLYDGGSVVLYSEEYETVFSYATMRRPTE